MELTAGTILEGKVKSIAKFGAFVSLPDGSTGLVHISEVAHAYVSDVREYLTEGQDVKVMVISAEDGKINLSIKRTQAPSAPSARPARPHDRPHPQSEEQPSGDPSFDAMLKRFMADSDSKISGIRQYADHKTKSRRR